MNLDSIRFSLNVINFMLFFGRSVVHIGHLFKGCCGSDECKLKMTLRNQKCNETHAGKQINLLWKKNSVEWIERAQSSGKESDYMIWIQLCVACMINRAPLNHFSLNLISVCVRGVWKWHTNLLQKWQNMVHASIGRATAQSDSSRQWRCRATAGAHLPRCMVMTTNWLNAWNKSVCTLR